MLKKNTTLLLLFMAFFAVLHAQVTTSNMTGVVKSVRNESLVGATITATHLPSGTVYKTVSRKDGQFDLPNMRVGGPYKVEVSFVGFDTQTFNDLFLQLGEDTRLTPTLSEGTQTLAAVSVSSRRGAVAKEKLGPSMQITQQQLTSLPTITRNVNDFARLVPQAQARTNASDGSTMGISFAGQSNRYNQFTIDGVNSTDIFGLAASGTNGGQAGINPIPFDAIEQLQVVLAPYDVTQGGFTGGGLNAVTRSGSNEFHGSVYGFNQNQGLVGKSATDRSKYGKFHDNTYGARLGGPIIANKLFFFVNYEGERRSSPLDFQPGSVNSNVKTSTLDSLSTWLKDGSKHAGWSYDPGAYNGINKTRQSDAVFARIDWNIDSKNKLTLRHSYTNGKSFVISDAQNSMQFVNNGYYFASTNNSTVLELNSNISSKMSNLARVTYTSTRDRRETPGAPFPYVKIKDGSLTYAFGTENSSGANKLSQDIITITDNFNIYSGKHVFTVGTNNEIYNTKNLFIQNIYGNYAYNSLADFYNDAKPNSYSYYSPAQKGSDGSAEIHAAQFGIYAQDVYRVTNNFKLTYGIRADIPVFFNKPGTNEAFNNSDIAKSYGVATDKVPATKILVAPRVGFTWDVKGDKQTIVRGGAGLFTGRIPLVWISNQYGGTGVLLNRYTASSGDLANIHFNPNNPPTGTGAARNEIDVTSHDFKFPRTFRANLALDQKLPWGVIGTFEAIYTKTLQDILYQDLNLAPSTSQLHLGNTSRPFYGSQVDPVNYSNIILLKNTNKGYAYNLTAQFVRPFSQGWTAMVSYSLGHSFGLNDGTSSTAMSNYRFAYNINGLGNLDLARNNYDQGSAVKAYVTKKFTYGKFYTSLGLVYNGYSGQTLSYVYFGDLNGDDGTTKTSVNTSNSADLMYMPTSSADFAPLYTFDSKGNVTGIKYSPEQQYAGFQEYMNSTQYTKDHIGKNTARNGARLPWENHFDFKLVQGFKFYKSHSLELSVDVFNIGNLLSKNWGHAYYASNQELQPLNVAAPTSASKFAGSNVDPSMQYTTFDPSNPKVTFDKAFGLNKYTGKPWAYADFTSRWNMQIGLRYTF
ncbi:carboxypeptidase regulatory-like domain-containing protein [Danxiaibacter flavus]|uniref:Carboxypeptidase regulatory-like domain-containing protein n=1 Tax=Danxiaibacter flavus TaxID=3049108 RepID=A0ABV3ZET4_9BACT|nr:carboxypeptidase regulatory-like domain-containing protein [Chitinophagaceae bacterium DXS]